MKQINVKEHGEIEKVFESICPRCGKTSKVTKTKYFFITQCESCKFDMGMPREVKPFKVDLKELKEKIAG